MKSISEGRWLVWAVNWLAAFILLSTTSCSKPKAQAAIAPPEVEIVQVEQKDIPIFHHFDAVRLKTLILHANAKNVGGRDGPS